ncbi:hypothetical protein JRQ81_000623, partial [Phrynocephalus forsythii]
AKAVIKQRIWDVELQEYQSLLVSSSADRSNVFTLPFYLKSISLPKHRRALTLARLNVLPSRLLDGRFL